MTKQMRIICFVRRCKSKSGEETHARVHAANFTSTLCGHDIDDGMWSIENEYPENGVTCPACKREIKKQTTRDK